MTSVFDLLVVFLALAAAAFPSQMLLLDALGKMPAPKTLRYFGVPAIVLFIGLLLFFFTSNRVLFGAVTLGIGSGILATLVLDSVRIPGYLLGWMPMDLPMRFGMMILNHDTKLKLRVMSGVLGHVNEQLKQGVPAKALMNEKGFPRLPMRTVRQLLHPAFNEAMQVIGYMVVTIVKGVVDHLSKTYLSTLTEEIENAAREIEEQNNHAVPVDVQPPETVQAAWDLGPVAFDDQGFIGLR